MWAMSNLENDFIKAWLMGLLALIGMVIILGIAYYKANVIVEAAYKASTPIVEQMRSEDNE